MHTYELWYFWKNAHNEKSSAEEIKKGVIQNGTECTKRS